MRSRWEGIQNKLWGMQEGCFFLTLCSIAEEYNISHGRDKVDLVDAVNKAFDMKWVKSDYTVLNDTALLSWLCNGAKVSKRMSSTCGLLKANEYSACKYALDNKLHFRRRYFDVYTNSNTVKNGEFVCYYIYTIGE